MPRSTPFVVFTVVTANGDAEATRHADSKHVVKVVKNVRDGVDVDLNGTKGAGETRTGMSANNGYNLIGLHIGSTQWTTYENLNCKMHIGSISLVLLAAAVASAETRAANVSGVLRDAVSEKSRVRSKSWLGVFFFFSLSLSLSPSSFCNKEPITVLRGRTTVSFSLPQPYFSHETFLICMCRHPTLRRLLQLYTSKKIKSNTNISSCASVAVRTLN